MTRIGVTYHEGLEPSDAFCDALGELGDVVTIPTNDELPARLQQDALDIVFSVARRTDKVARRLQVAAFLDFFNIPFVGGDALAQVTCLQRTRLMETLSYHGVATPAFTLIERVEQVVPLARRAFPVAVRSTRPDLPFDAHIAHDFDDLSQAVESRLDEAPDESVLVESVLAGDSFTCALLGNGRELSMLPIIAHDDASLAHHGHHLVANGAATSKTRRARVSDGLTEAIESIAFRAWGALGCRDVARVDVQLDDSGVPHVTAVDPLPALSFDDADVSMRHAASAAGLDDREFVQRCLLQAAMRARVELDSAPAFRRLPRRTPPGSVFVAIQS